MYMNVWSWMGAVGACPRETPFLRSKKPATLAQGLVGRLLFHTEI